MVRDNTNIEEVKLSFSGLDADKGSIDARELTLALHGWREYWELTNSTFFNKELTTKPLPSDLRPIIRIRALEHSSFDVIGQIIIPIGLMVSYDILKYLWKWRKSLLERHIKNKKDFIVKEEAVENIKRLARNFDIQSINSLEVTNLLELTDEALNSFVEPINNSSKKIIITSTSSKQTILLTSNDKLALQSGYYLEPGIASKELERFSVKFIRIHTETGNAIIAFDNPADIYQMGHEYSTIIDPAVKKLRNVYTRALYEGTSLEVWGRKVFNKSNNKFLRWEISKDLPADNNPLFDKK